LSLFRKRAITPRIPQQIRSFHLSNPLSYIPNFDCCFNCKFIEHKQCTLRHIQIPEPEDTNCSSFTPSRKGSLWQGFTFKDKSFSEDVEDIARAGYYLLEDMDESFDTSLEAKYDETQEKLQKKDLMFIYYYQMDDGNYTPCGVQGNAELLFGKENFLQTVRIPREYSTVQDVPDYPKLITISGKIAKRDTIQLPTISGPLYSTKPFRINPKLFQPVDFDNLSNKSPEELKQMYGSTNSASDTPVQGSRAEPIIRVPYHEDMRPIFSQTKGRCEFCGILGNTEISLDLGKKQSFKLL